MGVCLSALYVLRYNTQNDQQKMTSFFSLSVLFAFGKRCFGMVMWTLLLIALCEFLCYFIILYEKFVDGSVQQIWRI